MISPKRNSKFACATATILLLAGGCAKVTMEGGEKPIHMIVDVNIKVDHELDQFFAFEKQAATTQPATAATTQSSSPPTTQTASSEVVR